MPLLPPQRYPAGAMHEAPAVSPLCNAQTEALSTDSVPLGCAA